MLLRPAGNNLSVIPAGQDQLGRGQSTKYDILEVGFGDGRFTVGLAQRNPQAQILAVEISVGSVLRALKRFKREGIQNLWVYHGEARFALRNLVQPQSLSRVYVNFPDPWPKARHEDHRLLQASFFRRLSTRLRDDGALYLTTDHQEYWQFAQAQAQESGLFEVETTSPPLETLVTKYALKWKEQNRSFYHAIFSKLAQDPKPWTPLEVYPMPHALLEGQLPQLQNFDKQIIPFTGGTAVILEAHRSLDGRSYTFLTHLEEEDLVQQVLIEARPSDKGVFVGMSSFGAPLPTAGVKAAVGWLAEWLEGQGLRVVQKSY
jgi:tRNA (guanine-N7-)-methyltransferase